MKNLILTLGLGLFLITACLIYLMRTGVAIRASTLIRPSVVSSDLSKVTQAVVLRLAPGMKTAHYVVIGSPSGSEEARSFLGRLREEFERIHKTSVHLIHDATHADDETLKNCAKPCWLEVSDADSHELAERSFIENRIRPLRRDHMSLTWIAFSPIEKVPDECISKKILNFNCMKDISVHEAQRKMKSDDRYFFLKSYKGTDHFLFVQKKD